MSSDRAREMLAALKSRRAHQAQVHGENGEALYQISAETDVLRIANIIEALSPTPPPAVGDEEEEVRNALGGYSLKDGTLADSLSNFIGNLDVSAEVVDRHHLRSCAEEIERAVAVIKALAFARHRRASAFGGTVPREVQEILWQYESDLLHPPEGDSVQRRLDRVRKAILALQPNEEAGG